MSEELFYQNQLQKLEDIKSTYFSQLDEVEKKRAEISLKKEQMKADEMLIMEEYNKIRDAKKLISREYEKLVSKNDALKQAKKEYEQKRVDFLKKETELASRMDRYEISYDELRKRKSAHYRTLHSQLEDEKALQKREKRLVRTRKRLDEKSQEVSLILREIESSEMDIEIQREKIERRREYVRYLETTLSSKESDFSSREKELSKLMQKTEEEIGRQTTIHKQQISVNKKDARIEQQLSYIKNLEDEVFDLKSKLEQANTELNRLKICSRIVEKNLEILAN